MNNVTVDVRQHKRKSNILPYAFDIINNEFNNGRALAIVVSWVCSEIGLCDNNKRWTISVGQHRSVIYFAEETDALAFKLKYVR